jgi:hypothetical protein
VTWVESDLRVELIEDRFLPFDHLKEVAILV